jgi:hypothetical protein
VKVRYVVVVGLVAILGAALLAAFIQFRSDPPIPGSGPTANVYTYRDEVTGKLVGQSWSGCARPAGQWGTLSGQITIERTNCDASDFPPKPNPPAPPAPQ